MKRILLGIILCLIFTGVSYTQENKKINVAVTILPQVEFVKRVGGDKVKVTVMIPPGASPHTYEPKPSQLREISKAKMYAKVGSGIEFELAWMDKIASINKKMLIVDCSKGIKLIDNDPHIWLSPGNVKIMVENIYQGLIKIDPVNKEYYWKNREKYLKKLDKLDKEITQVLSGMKNRKIMVYHPAWGYFCREYNLKQIPIEREGKKPTPQGIASLIKEAEAKNIKIIFASPQFSTKSAEVIAREIGGKVVLIDPLAENYLENMRKVAKVFAG